MLIDAPISLSHRPTFFPLPRPSAHGTQMDTLLFSTLAPIGLSLVLLLLFAAQNWHYGFTSFESLKNT